LVEAQVGSLCDRPRGPVRVRQREQCDEGRTNRFIGFAESVGRGDRDQLTDTNDRVRSDDIPAHGDCRGDAGADGRRYARAGRHTRACRHTNALDPQDEGRGDKIVKLPAQDAPTFARITGKGSGNFAVISYVGSDYDDLLVNEIGSYAGSVYIAAGVNRLKVTSSGTWTIEVRPITSARAWDGVTALTGKGDSVAILTGGAGGITTIKNKSRSNFAVIAYSPEGEYLDLLVNEIGTYSGEVLVPDADPIVLAISAVGGTWSLSAVGQ
jgi:hypothetical protein